MTKYTPISCHFYDLLEIWAMRRLTVEIVHRETTDATATTQTIAARIADLYARDGQEFMVLSTGQTLRLDQLIRVNGTDVSNGGHCSI